MDCGCCPPPHAHCHYVVWGNLSPKAKQRYLFYPTSLRQVIRSFHWWFDWWCSNLFMCSVRYLGQNPWIVSDNKNKIPLSNMGRLGTFTIANLKHHRSLDITICTCSACHLFSTRILDRTVITVTLKSSTSLFKEKYSIGCNSPL